MSEHPIDDSGLWLYYYCKREAAGRFWYRRLFRWIRGMSAFLDKRLDWIAEVLCEN